MFDSIDYINTTNDNLNLYNTYDRTKVRKIEMIEI